MNAECFHITTIKTARYYTLGLKDYGIKTIWFVLHGYGQLAEEFVRSFQDIVDEKTLVVAPEALNRFYTNGFSGKAGASWMTKEDRENEIKDYLIYLNNVFSQVTSTFFVPKLKINVLGFSQGTATASRWILSKKVIAENLLLCGGLLPKDIDFKIASLIFKSTKLNYFFGDEDKTVAEKNLDMEKQFLHEHKIEAGFNEYSGSHEVNQNLILKIKNNLAD
jgi:predicted esterase